MADPVSVNVKIGVRETLAAFEKLDKAVNRATMYGLRAAGRAVKTASRRKAPVGDASGSGTNSVDPHPGQLKASIHSDKKLRREGTNAYSVRVAPRGIAVMPYRRQQEAEKRYMDAGHTAAQATMRAGFERAYRDTLRKWS